jgi:nucleoid DNA-binding protein
MKYSLNEKLLTERPDDYSAIAHAVSSLDTEAVLQRIINKGTTVTKTDVLAVLNSFYEVVRDAHLEGHTVNLPLINTSFSISGVFDGPMDSFDPNRHKLNINVSKGTILRDAEKNVKTEKTNVQTPLPQIQEVKDSVTGKVNERITSGGVVEVRGYNLKIDGDNPKCGLWFVDDSGAEVKAETIIENKPTRIIAIIPTLKSGNWQVKVVSQFSGGGKFLKEPKMFIYQKKMPTGKVVNP